MFKKIIVSIPNNLHRLALSVAFASLLLIFTFAGLSARPGRAQSPDTRQASWGPPSAEVLRESALGPAALPTINIGDASVTEGNSGPAHMVFAISLSSSYTDTITVTYATQDQSAVASQDYVAIPPSLLVFASSETTKNIIVTVIGDLVDEGLTETLSLTLSAPINATPGDMQGIGTIADDDEAVISISDEAVIEGGENTTTTMIFEVTLSTPSASTVYVGYATADNTAKAPKDYIAIPNTTLTFAPQQTSRSITATVNGDLIDEGAGETFFVNLIYVNTTITDNQGIGTITDDDKSSVIVTPISLTIDETGPTSDGYTVYLGSEPSGNVRILISSDEQTTQNKSQLNFNATNWQDFQVVTVIAKDDTIAEDTPHTGIITHTVDPNSASEYLGIPITDVTAMITDNDMASIEIFPTELSLTEGQADTYVITLTSRPVEPVTITISSVSPDISQLVITETQIVFTHQDWEPRAFEIAAYDDEVDENPHGSSIISHSLISDDPKYGPLSVPTVTVNITDDDFAGVIIQSDFLQVAEGDFTDVYSVTLSSEPTHLVRITISPNNQVSVSSNELVFSTSDWDQTRQVTVTAVDDRVAESTHNGLIEHLATSDDPKYQNITIPDLTPEIIDNDNAGVSFDPTLVEASEDGITATYTILLESKPTQPVTVTVITDNQAGASPLELIFDNDNWDDPQPITVAAVDDSVDEASPHPGVIQHTVDSEDTFYQLGMVDSVSVDITDNDTATVTHSTDVFVIEGEGPEAITFTLGTEPTSPVTITLLTGSQTSVDPFKLVFNESDWDQAKLVDVTAIDDLISENTPHTGMISSTVTSSDPNYDRIHVDPVTVFIGDNDSPGIFPNRNTLSISEDGITDTYKVRLTTKPTEVVSVTIASEGQSTADPNPLLFDSTNWNIFQQVTIQAIDDLIAEGTHIETLRHESASQDSFYDQLSVASIQTTIVDNDIAMINLTPTTVMTTTEAGSTAIYTVSLNSEPRSTVSLVLSSMDPSEGMILSPPSWVLTFYPANWNQPQNFVLIGRDDTIDDETSLYIMRIDSASPDSFYNDMFKEIQLVNLDNDGPTVSIGDISVVEGNQGVVNAIFEVTLSQPTSVDVQFDYATVDNTAKAVAPTGGDYVMASGSVALPAGNIKTLITTLINGDTLPEYNETYYLKLSNPKGDITFETPQPACTILDDDPKYLHLSGIFQKFSWLIFRDFFNAAIGWNIVPEPGASTFLKEGEYHIVHTIANRNVRAVAPIKASAIPASFIIKTSARLENGADDGTRYGMLFNWIDASHFYRFLVSPTSGEYWIYKFQSEWVILAQGTSSAIIANQPNSLQLNRSGSNIYAYANDILLTTVVNESTYLGGQVGLTILSATDLQSAEQAEAVFTDFEAWKLSR